mgnify:CR=1 FL=1
MIDKLVSNYMKIYGKEVLEQRAIPDFRDGLKPVHRRILFSLYENRVFPNSHFIKSARIVGDTLGKYHPHSDQAIYDSLVGMAHLRYKPIVPQGNYGNPYTNYPPAAMRYTEVKLSKIGMLFFEMMPIADMVPNYDERSMEPLFLPTRFPFLLTNGSQGIAVGAVTNIPPHNLKEVVETIQFFIKNRNAKIEDLVDILKGPDYPCGGILLSDRKAVINLYKNGHGILKYSCDYHIDGNQLIITSYAPSFNYVSFMEHCDKLSKDGLIDFVRDETDKKKGIRIVVGFNDFSLLKKNVISKLTTSVAYRFNITERIDPENSIFKSVNLLTLLNDWINYRKTIEEKSIKNRINELTSEISKVEAKLIALRNMKRLFKVLSSSGSVEDLKKSLGITTEQAEYILSIPIGSIAKRNEESLISDLDKLNEEMGECNSKLSNLDQVIYEDLERFKSMSDDRLTKIGESKYVVKQSYEKTYLFFNRDTKRIRLSKTIDRVGLNTKIIDATKGVMIATDKLISLYSASELKSKRKLSKDVVDVDSLKEYVLTINSKGRYSLMRVPDKKHFNTIKGTIVQIVGLDKEDMISVLSQGKKKRIRIVKFSDLKLSNRIGRGRLVDKRFKAGRAFVVNKDDLALNSKGELIKMDDCLSSKNIHIIGDFNLVIYLAGKQRRPTRLFLSKEDLLSRRKRFLKRIVEVSKLV